MTQEPSEKRKTQGKLSIYMHRLSEEQAAVQKRHWTKESELMVIDHWGSSTRPGCSDSSWPLCVAFILPGCKVGHLWNEGFMICDQTRWVTGSLHGLLLHTKQREG